MDKTGRADKLALGALLVGGLALAASRFNDLLGLTGDNAVYLLLARNLASGQPYDNAGFPWGYPALLTPGVALFGPDHLIDAVPWLKLITIATFLLALALFYLLFRLRHSPLLAFGAVALFAVNDVTMVYTDDLMTELPYTAAVGLALLFWFKRIQPPVEQDWSVDDEQAMGLAWRDLILAGALLTLPYYLRTIGLALLAAGPLALFWRRRWREGVLLGVIEAALAAPWALFSTLTDPNKNYTASLLMRDPYHPELGKVSSLGEFIGRLLNAAGFYATQVWPTMTLPSVSAAFGALGLILLLAALVGFVLRLLRRIEISEIYVVAFMFILLAWPWQGDRFLLPIVPFLLHYVMETVAALGRLVEGRLAIVRNRNMEPGAGSREPGTALPVSAMLVATQTSSLPPTIVNSQLTTIDPPNSSQQTYNRQPTTDNRQPRLRLPAPGSRLLLGAVLLGLALPNLALDGQAAALNIRYLSGDSAATGWGPEWTTYFEASRWVGQNSPVGSVVLSRKSSLTEIYAGRPSELIPLIAPEQFPDWLKQHNVTYIIEDAFNSTHTVDHLIPAIKQKPAMYKLLYSTAAPINRVWQVVYP